YATAADVKERLDIQIGDISQDSKINVKLTQADRIINFILKSHGVSVPVEDPVELLNILVEIEADYAAGLFIEDRGPQWRDQAAVLKKRALDALDIVVKSLRKGAVEVG
ncbi:MAG: hypothetical protein QW761_00205, partial [Candidatus Aenigmatarchaeota archaeon]